MSTPASRAAMKLCVVSFKPCWRDSSGRWMAQGGFPLQMAAIASLFDRVTLVIVEGERQEGGLPLPAEAEVIGLRSPKGTDGARKVSVLAHIAYYLTTIAAEVRRADVVHVPVPGDISFLGFVVALLSRKRLIVRYGSSWAVTAQTTLMHRVTRACMRLFAGGRNVMIATGAGEAPPALRLHWLYATSLTRAELGAITPVFDRGLHSPARMVYVGRLSPEKGVRYLLRALALLRDAGTGTIPQLTLLGDGPERRELEAEVRALRLGDLVRFAGHLDRAGLNEQLSEADFCVQPSLTESLCKAWLDVMAHGLPVISSDVGFAAAVFGQRGERGWLVPPGDAAALAAAIRAVVHEPREWSSLRRRCRSFVESRTLEAWAGEIGRICASQWDGTLTAGKVRI